MKEQIVQWHSDQIITRRDDGSIDVTAVNTEPSMTQQHHKDECDINNIMRKYETTGQFTGHIREGGQYADFSQITDYQGMLEAVKYAESAFMSLPAHVRKNFNNNPDELLSFIQNPQNYDEGVKLGLIDPEIKLNKQLKQKQYDDLNDKQKSTPQNKTNSNTGKSTPPKNKVDESSDS